MYEQALIAFLHEFPKHKAAPEARFRLGEMRQRQEKYAEAEAEYAQVKGDPSFEVRAAFATAQCLVKRLEQTPEGTKPDPELMTRARAALDAFWSQTANRDPKSFGDAPVGDFSGQAALMSAYLAALAEKPDYEACPAVARRLRGEVPEARERASAGRKLRLLALSRTGNLAGCGRRSGAPGGRDARSQLSRRSRHALSDDGGARAGRRQDRSRDRRQECRARPQRARARGRRRSPSCRRSCGGGCNRRRRRYARSAATSRPRSRCYRAVLRTRPTSISARAGVARLFEKQGKLADARALWDEIVNGPTGKQGWMEAHYQSARLSVALGDQARACTVLRKVPAEMVVNANADTPKHIQELLRACPP